MSIAQLFEQKNTVFSLEVFPPKKESSVDTIYRTLEELAGLNPDFISVTYGAGGDGGQNTCQIASLIKNNYHIRPLAHLTCAGYSRQEVSAVANRLKAEGVEDILALRGDLSPDRPPKTDFSHASDLVQYLKEEHCFGISGACYPEGHVEAPDLATDIVNLCKKVEAGAEHLISQLFFDNTHFYEFLKSARAAGIAVPIQAGIMPVVNKKQIERMVSLCGASLPTKFTKMMCKYENHPEALRDAGIAYAVDQIVDLISNGVDGIHLYTMNNPFIARRIADSISSMIRV